MARSPAVISCSLDDTTGSSCGADLSRSRWPSFSLLRLVALQSLLVPLVVVLRYSLHHTNRMRENMLPPCTNFQTTQIIVKSEDVNGDERYGGEVMKWENHIHRRSVAETAGSGNSLLILAEKRTHRRDPLDGSNRYSGGWNISNSHCWAVMDRGPWIQNPWDLHQGYCLWAKAQCSNQTTSVWVMDWPYKHVSYLYLLLVEIFMDRYRLYACFFLICFFLSLSCFPEGLVYHLACLLELFMLLFSSEVLKQLILDQTQMSLSEEDGDIDKVGNFGRFTYGLQNREIRTMFRKNPLPMNVYDYFVKIYVDLHFFGAICKLTLRLT